jgi:hypothetical protein
MADISNENPIHQLEPFFPAPDADLDYLENYSLRSIWVFMDVFITFFIRFVSY